MGIPQEGANIEGDQQYVPALTFRAASFAWRYAPRRPLSRAMIDQSFNIRQDYESSSSRAAG